MNKVILMGRLTSDPEVYAIPRESRLLAIARFTLAVDRRVARRDGEQTADFIGCVAFGRTAEFAEKYFRQGMRMVISGRIQTGSYTNRDGRESVYHRCGCRRSQEFAESKATSDALRNNSGMGGGYQPQAPSAPSPSGAAGDGFMNIPDGIDEELPFN